MTDPQRLLEDLKANASSRKVKSLDLIFKLLQHHSEAGTQDFSIATIGRLSAKAGGPSSQSIRNKGGKEYRRLIEAWAVHNGTTTKKPISPGNRNIPKRDSDVLRLIDDPALRAVVGAIIAERDRFCKELRTLKSQIQFTIDRRPETSYSDTSALPLASIAKVLTGGEQEALKHAISDNLFETRGWIASKTGRVKDNNGRHIYKAGYLTAIEKVLDMSKNHTHSVLSGAPQTIEE